MFEERSFSRAEAQNGDESRALTPKRIRTSYTRTGKKEVILEIRYTIKSKRHQLQDF